MLSYFGIGLLFAIITIILFAFKERGYKMDFFNEFDVTDADQLGNLLFFLMVLWPSAIIMFIDYLISGFSHVSANDFIKWVLTVIERLIKPKDNCNGK